MDYNIILPSKPKIVTEKDFSGTYEIEGLYPGYGHTLGNSLRRIILSSMPGAAITMVTIDGASHEFSTIEGVKEDVIAILLNLRKINLQMATDEPQELILKKKGLARITARDIEVPGQIKILNPEQSIAEITNKNTALHIIMRVEKGIGYVPKEVHHKNKVEIGTIALDAVFTPIRRVNYEVENMRVGDRTDYNRLRMFIETNGSILPREALESSITVMIRQLEAILGFEEEKPPVLSKEEIEEGIAHESIKLSRGRDEENKEFLKTRIDTLGFSTRTANALHKANIRTVGGLARKKEEDLLAIDGLGEKGVQEIKKTLGNFGITLK